MAEIVIRISDKALKIVGVLLGGLLLVWACFGLWSSGVFTPHYQIQMSVPEAEGVRVGASVLLNGLPVGKVSGVKLAEHSEDSNRKIEIDMRIPKQFQGRIPTDSTAYLIRNGLLGERIVDIHLGSSGTAVSPGGEINVGLVKEASATDFVDALKKIGAQGNCRTEQTPENKTSKNPKKSGQASN